MADLAQHVDESQIVVEVTVLVLPSKAEHSIHFDLISQVGFDIVGVDYFVVRYFLTRICLVFEVEVERTLDVATCEGDEMEIFGVLLFLVDAATDHQRCAEEG